MIISEFFIPVKKLRITDFVHDYQLFQDKDKPLNKNLKPCHYCIKLFEYA